MSTKGRKLRMFKGTRYYNAKHQRQEDGYCRVYDKKRQLSETWRQNGLTQRWSANNKE
ncbi:hypothetical protein H1230_12410 [Paenibacillus sp. 19GGS1-52]|uniref:hypothetical protein n=1 Tax=Paenibacillus sp. 19GGS1-52 TaxID=2758563 RepID=UPI001EFB2A62|nr:hypothetical protein [Paenibacillus sp. 19GGS1-52]ULO09501.1 hypothetical protein H1230_12410 [Paenibacillus sp. 19GGS1-52]